ncbi:MAG: hypothetical protein EXR75_02960 [Myxococcales bacterium]|nr:hypothetical protein [Myxococcales bacterium]
MNTQPFLSSSLFCALSVGCFAFAACAGSSDSDTGGAGAGDASTTTASSTATGTGSVTGTATATATGTTSTGGMGGCHPGDVTMFKHAWAPSIGLHKNKCTAMEVSDFVGNCLGKSSTKALCDAFTNAHVDCGTCAVALPEANPMGPLVAYEVGKFVVIDGNAGHCVSAFEMNNSAFSCGAKMDKAQKCALAACFDVCTPIDDNADFAAFVGCVEEALLGACKTFDTAGDACVAELIKSQPEVSACIWDEGKEEFTTYAERLITLHCGPPK